MCFCPQNNDSFEAREGHFSRWLFDRVFWRAQANKTWNITNEFALQSPTRQRAAQGRSMHANPSLIQESRSPSLEVFFLSTFNYLDVLTWLLKQFRVAECKSH